MKFTDSQQKAINAKDKNLTLSAGAGSGKTTVLVSRYISLLASKQAGIKEMLAITFTNKSAADMRIKVRKHISDQIKSTSGSQKRFWQGVKDQFEQATISTIHSFALQVLRSHPLESKINPEASMIDEIEAYIMLSETVRDIIREYYQDEQMQTLVQNVKSVDRTIDLLCSIYQKIRSLGAEIESVSKMALGFEESKREELVALKSTISNNLIEIRELLGGYKGKAAFSSRYLDTDIKGLITRVTDVKTTQDSAYVKLSKDLTSLLSRPVKIVKEEVDKIKDAFNQMTESFAYLETIPLYHLLDRVYQEIDKEYSKAKKNRRVLDYSDLEWGLLNLLRKNIDVREYYINKYKYVMVDEFQDTSPMQQELIKLLSPYSKNGLFIVGDPRQSIYRFRAAELAGFLEMRKEIISSGGKGINLAENFRSRAKLIDFQNDFFTYLFEQSTLDYEDVVAGLDDSCKDVKVEMWLPHPEEIEEEMKSSDVRQVEAKYIAQNIKEYNRNGIKFQDIAILFRALTDIKLYESALSDLGIPYQVSGSRGLFDKQEIVDIINLLKYFSNSEDQISLVGILRTPFFGFSDEELLRIRMDNKGLDNEIRLINMQKFDNALEVLNKYKDKFKLESISKVLDEFINSTDYLSVLLLSRDYGKQAVVNVNKFLAIIRDLESKNTTTLTEVLEYIRVMRSGNALMGEASVSEEVDAVQLMSIHQSKGLEFHTVIIPQLERRILQSPKDMICFTKDLGLVIRSRGLSDKTQDNFYFSKMKEKEKELDLEESYRLFYVGSTRAEERLILSAAPAKFNKTKQSYFDYIREYLTLNELSDEVIEYEHLKLVPQSLVSDISVSTENKVYDSLETPLLEKPKLKLNRAFNLSATALMTHNECSRRYYYRFIKEIPDYDIDLKKLDKEHYSASELGTIIHKVFEITNGENAYELFEVLLERVNRTSDVISKYRYKGKQMINNYLNSQVYKKQRDGEVVSELGFSLSINKKILTGLIDKLIIKGNKYSIIDIKTGRMNEDATKKYLLQNAVYAIAVADSYGYYPSEIHNYFASEDEEYDYLVDLPDYDTSLHLVKESINALEKDLERNCFQKKLDECEHCNYQKLCMRKGGVSNG
jgi:ATP-dependent helicase/nuclease subunit A